MLDKLKSIQNKINELESQKHHAEMEYYILGDNVSKFQREIDVLKQEAWEIFKDNFDVEE